MIDPPDVSRQNPDSFPHRGFYVILHYYGLASGDKRLRRNPAYAVFAWTKKRPAGL